MVGKTGDSSLVVGSKNGVDKMGEISKNVFRTILSTAFNVGGESIWERTVLSAYIYLISGSVMVVGNLTTLLSTGQLLSTIPAGFLADRFRRDTTIRFGSTLAVLGAAVMYYAIFSSDYNILGWGLTIWGAATGFVLSANWALYAESVHPEEAPYYFTKRMMIVKFSSSIGPLITIFLFLYIGDQWTVEACAIVMLIGVSVNMIGMFILCTLSDDYAVVIKNEDQQGRDDETLLLDHDSVEDENAEEQGQNTVHYVQLDEVDEDHDIERTVSPFVDLPGYGEPGLLFFPGHRVIPSFVLMHDVIVGIGFGISLRFFLIFYMQYCDLTPIWVQVVYMVQGFGMGTGHKIIHFVSKKIGRLQAVCFMESVSILFLLGSTLAYQYKWCSDVVVVILTCFRFAFVKCTDGLTKNVMLESVPRNERAKWSAVEALNKTGIAGSSALGGWIVAHYGILYSFKVTAVVQLVGLIPLILIMKRVKSFTDRV